MPVWSASLKARFRRFRSERLDNLLLAGVVVLIAVVTASVTLQTQAGKRFDLWVLQTFFRGRGDAAPPEDVVIVALDDESYIKLNASTRWPVPRKASADVMERIVNARPKIVILDVNVPEETHDPEANDRLERAILSGHRTGTGALLP